MARGRHARRSSLLGWLLASPTEPAHRSWRDVHAHSLVLLSDQVQTVRSELAGARAAHEHAAAAAALSDRRAARLEQALAAAQDDVAELRGELAALREELVWAFAERRSGVVEPAGAPDVRPVASAG